MLKAPLASAVDGPSQGQVGRGCVAVRDEPHLDPPASSFHYCVLVSMLSYFLCPFRGLSPPQLPHPCSSGSIFTSLLTFLTFPSFLAREVRFRYTCCCPLSPFLLSTSEGWVFCLLTCCEHPEWWKEGASSYMQLLVLFHTAKIPDTVRHSRSPLF